MKGTRKLGWMVAALALAGVSQSQQEPAIELPAGAWEAQAGAPDAESFRSIHVSQTELEAMQRAGDSASVGVSFIVGKDGRVESAVTVYGPKRCLAEAERLIRARTFQPFVVDGKAVRAKLYEQVEIYPQEQWADVRIPFPEVKDWGQVQIGFTIAGNEGSGRGYTVALDGAGMVRFNGGSSSRVPGMHVARIAPDAVKELVEEFRRADFYSLRNSYSVRAFDAAGFTTSIDIDGQVKRVTEVMGSQAGMPDVVKALESRVATVAGVNRWLKGDERTRAALESEHWDFAAETPVNFAIFSNAVQRGDAALVERFMAAKAPVARPVGKPDSPLLEAVKAGDLPLVRRMVRPVRAMTAEFLSDGLGAAASSGRVEMVQFWLDRGADPMKPLPAHDYRDQGTVLGNAVASGDAAVVRKVLEWPLDVSSAMREGDPGQAVLFWALEHAKAGEIGGVMTALLKAGAKAAWTRGGQYNEAVIFEACRAPEAMKPLLAAGADVNGRFGKQTDGTDGKITGYSLLMTCSDHYGAVKELLADGADPTVTAPDGRTALVLARERGCEDCAALLEAAIERKREDRGPDRFDAARADVTSAWSPALP
jgi:hypothetical protein